MTEQEVEAFRTKLAELTQRASEAEVRLFIDEQFPRLPDDLQNEIAANLLITSFRAETARLEAGEQE